MYGKSPQETVNSSTSFGSISGIQTGPEMIKGSWTRKEDNQIIELVGKYGARKWSVIAKYLPQRTGKQCRERWHNHLNPEIKKGPWTEFEDWLIHEARKLVGNKWAEISKIIDGR